jgi:hypothetical protein
MSEMLKFYTISKKAPVTFADCPIGLFLIGDGLYLKPNATTRIGIPQGTVRPDEICTPETTVVPVEIRLTTIEDLYLKTMGTVEPKFTAMLEAVYKGVESTMGHATNIIERVAEVMKEPKEQLFEVWMDQWVYANGAKTLTRTGIVTKLGEAKAKTFELAAYEVCRGYDPMSFHCPQGKAMLGQNFLFPSEATARISRNRV